MNCLIQKTNSELDRSFSRSGVLKCLKAIALIACLGLSGSLLKAQVIADNFNSGGPDTASGWTAYDGCPSTQTRFVTYEPDPAGGFVYHLTIKGAPDATCLFTRGGSYRADFTYVGDNFFSAIDLVNQ